MDLRLAAFAVASLFCACAASAAAPGSFRRAPLTFPKADARLARALTKAITDGGPLYFALGPSGRRMLEALPRFDLEAEQDLALLGALAQHLEPGFEAELEKAAQAESGDPLVAEAAAKLDAAYAKGAHQLLPTVQQTLSDAFVAFSNGGLDNGGLQELSRWLRKVDLYGDPIASLNSRLHGLAAEAALEDNQAEILSMAASLGQEIVDFKILGKPLTEPAAPSAEAERQLKIDALASFRYARLPDGPKKDALMAEAGRPFGKADAADPRVKRVELGEMPLEGMPTAGGVAEEMLGKPVSAADVAAIVEQALKFTYPDREYKTDFDEALRVWFVRDEGDWTYAFQMRPDGSRWPAPGARRVIYFAVPGMSYGEEAVFIREALLPYGIAVHPAGQPGAYQIDAYFQDPGEARRSTLN